MVVLLLLSFVWFLNAKYLLIGTKDKNSTFGELSKTVYDKSLQRGIISKGHLTMSFGMDLDKKKKSQGKLKEFLEANQSQVIFSHYTINIYDLG